MAGRPKATLVVEKGVSSTRDIPLHRSVYVLGSASEADISLENPYVSRMHARIVEEGDRFEIRDLGSKNGTFLNGARLGDGGERLRSGDQIELAKDQVVLRLQESGSTLTLHTTAELESDDLGEELPAKGPRPSARPIFHQPIHRYLRHIARIPQELTRATSSSKMSPGRARWGVSGALYSQSAIARLNSLLEVCLSRPLSLDVGVESWVLRGGGL